MYTSKNLVTVLCVLLGYSGAGFAAHEHHLGHQHENISGQMHLHEKGGWMFTYKFMHMDMEDNRDGTSSLSPDEIVTTVPNRFFGIAGQPPTLRVVPTEMTTQMHMFGLMYGWSDDLTLMAMVPYIDKDMDHITYMGGMGTTQLGKFTTRSEGLGDVKLKGLYRLYEQGSRQVLGSLGISLPTGSNTEKDTILTPMGMTPEVRLPYPMQLGSGTYDILAGLQYRVNHDAFSWGAQYDGVFRTGSDEGYTLGDEHKVSGWIAKQLKPSVGVHARLTYLNVDNIDGIDPNIVAPVQTADPDNQGKERWDLALGVTLTGTEGAWQGHELGLEVSKPLHQDLDGPQLEADTMITATYRKSW